MPQDLTFTSLSNPNRPLKFLSASCGFILILQMAGLLDASQTCFVVAIIAIDSTLLIIIGSVVFTLLSFAFSPNLLIGTQVFVLGMDTTALGFSTSSILNLLS